MTKTRPAPLEATYKPDVHPSWCTSRSDVAPSGADRALFDPSYKDFALTELGRRIAKRADSGPWVANRSNALNDAKFRKTVTNLTDQTFVNFVSLADVAKGGDGAKSALW